MKRLREYSVADFLCHFIAYGLFVSVYLFLVLHFLTDWLKAIFTENRTVYSIVALLLILVQAIGLERVSSGLLLIMRRRKK
jgi:hypothetical protein